MPLVNGINYPVTNLFSLKAAAITAINAQGTAVKHMVGRSEGESDVKLDAALAGGTFGLREQQRLQRICLYHLGLTYANSFNSL